MIADRAARVEAFRRLHARGAAFLMPNFWDAGSARILEGLGFAALATTSAGFALTKGRRDYGVSRDEAIAHAREAAAAVDIPVSADLEGGFGPDPEDCAETIRRAVDAGLAGGSIEDFSGDSRAPIMDLARAVERVAAAAEAARAAPGGFVLTARAESFLHEDGHLGATIARLQAFAAAGADVLFAPGLPDLGAVRAACAALDKPVSVLVLRGLAAHAVDEFREAGVARLSLGGALAFDAYAALVETADAIRRDGRFDALGARSSARGAIAPALKP